MAIVFTSLFLGNKIAFAQQGKREFVKIEIQIKKEYFLHKTNIPITKNPFTDDGKNFIEGEFKAEGLATVDCIKCPLSSELGVLSYAIRLNENSVEANISVTFDNKSKCSINNKKFVLQRGKREEFNMKCGVKISAYYE